MSGARKRGLVRLAVLIGLVGWLVVLAGRGFFSGGTHQHSTSVARASRASPAARLKTEMSPMRLPQPLHGATATPTGEGLLVIGGADRSDVSSDQVLLLDPRADRVSRAGALISPLHDAAAATVGDRALVFGGGASVTYDTVQELVSGGSARQVGHLPVGTSDLSAVIDGGAVYVLGGYDGQRPVASVFKTSDGGSLTKVAELPTAVRYTAAAATGGRIYAFGGELGNGADTDEIQEYEVATGRVSVVGHLPQGVDHASAVLLNGVIYLLGGRRNGVASDRILRFDPSRRAVVPAGRLPAPVFDAAAGTALGVAYLAGGIGARGTSVDSVMKLSQNP